MDSERFKHLRDLIGYDNLGIQGQHEKNHLTY